MYVQWNQSWEITGMRDYAPVLKIQRFLAEGRTFQIITEPSCHQRPPAMPDHIFVANGMVFQDRFYCNWDNTVMSIPYLFFQVVNLTPLYLNFFFQRQQLLGEVSATCRQARWRIISFVIHVQLHLQCSYFLPQLLQYVFFSGALRLIQGQSLDFFTQTQDSLLLEEPCMHQE